MTFFTSSRCIFADLSCFLRRNLGGEGRKKGDEEIGGRERERKKNGGFLLPVFQLPWQFYPTVVHFPERKKWKRKDDCIRSRTTITPVATITTTIRRRRTITIITIITTTIIITTTTRTKTTTTNLQSRSKINQLWILKLPLPPHYLLGERGCCIKHILKHCCWCCCCCWCCFWCCWCWCWCWCCCWCVVWLLWWEDKYSFFFFLGS